MFSDLRFDPTIQFSDIAVLLSILVIAWKIFRHMNRMEFKVEVMWGAFRDKFLTNGEIIRLDTKFKSRRNK